VLTGGVLFIPSVLGQFVLGAFELQPGSEDEREILRVSCLAAAAASRLAMARLIRARQHRAILP